MTSLPPMEGTPVLRTLSTTLALTAAAAATTTLVLGGSAGAADGKLVLNAQLTGAQEAPAPGDPDGKAKGKLRVDVVTGEICYKIDARKVEPLSAGHIHEKATGASTGPVVVTFTQTGPTTFAGCATNLEVARGLQDDPSEYYLNVHNAAYPGGALRGDLG